ncbi:MAG: O-antigen ligase family protein [Clostridia bacterium]|nr:O-antigen ligase family protein [Clostridia bacterium]
MRITQDKFLNLSTCIYFIIIYLSDNIAGNSSILVVPMLLFLLCSYLTHGRKIKVMITPLHLYILAFALFTLLSSLWATDRSLTLPKFNAMIFILVAMVVLMIDNYDDSGIDRLLKSIMYGGYVLSFIVLILFGFSNVADLLSSSTRIDNSVINANSLGMSAAYALVIHLYYILARGKLKLEKKDWLILPAVIALIVSGSRKAMLIVAVGFSGVIILRFWDENNRKKSWLRLIAFLIVAVILVVVVLNMSLFQNLNDRMLDVVEALLGNATRRTNSVWLRFQYILLGIDLFIQHPLLGVGIGNSNYYTELNFGINHYLHTNIFELLACGGLIGFCIYYSMYAYILYTMIKYRKYRTREYDVCMTLLIIQLFIGFALVQYFSKTVYIYLLLFYLEARKLKNAAKQAQQLTVDPADVTILE